MTLRFPLPDNVNDCGTRHSNPQKGNPMAGVKEKLACCQASNYDCPRIVHRIDTAIFGFRVICEDARPCQVAKLTKAVQNSGHNSRSHQLQENERTKSEARIFSNRICDHQCWTSNDAPEQTRNGSEGCKNQGICVVAAVVTAQVVHADRIIWFTTPSFPQSVGLCITKL